MLPFGLVLWVCVSMALSATVPAHSGLSRPPPVTCHLPACCRLRGTAHTLGYAKLSSGACPPFPLVSTAVGLWGTHAGRPHVRAGEIVVHGDAFYLACAASMELPSDGSFLIAFGHPLAVTERDGYSGARPLASCWCCSSFASATLRRSPIARAWTAVGWRCSLSQEWSLTPVLATLSSVRLLLSPFIPRPSP